MPYEPLGDDDAVKKTKIPPTFSVHRYASAIGNPVGAAGGMNDFGPTADTSEHTRTQKVVRMGRSFSVRMSSQGERSGVWVRVFPLVWSFCLLRLVCIYIWSTALVGVCGPYLVLVALSASSAPGRSFCF